MNISSKNRRIAAAVIAIPALIILPILVDLYYLSLYIIGVLILLPVMFYRMIMDARFEERFYRRWKRARNKGFWRNVFVESGRALVIMLVVVGLSQFIGNGLTPVTIIHKLTNAVLVELTIFILLISFAAGIATWYENEKRFNRFREE